MSSSSSSPPRRVLLIDCSGCRTPLQLPPGARAVRCALCNAITRVGDPRSLPPPPATHPSQQHGRYGTSPSYKRQHHPSPPSLKFNNLGVEDDPPMEVDTHHPSPPSLTFNNLGVEDDTPMEVDTQAEGSRICQFVSLEDIKEATENFDERYALGQGGEAKVYLARIMLGRSKITQVAVKHLKPHSFGFDDEIRIMPKIQHPNIVSLLSYCNDSGQKILIYEYMANGSLADFLQKKQKPTAIDTTTSSLSWQQRLKISVGAALGLKHLHTETKEFSKGIIHRDIKPENILLDANWVAKISDFGMFKLSRADQIDSAMPTMLKGTGGYYAPEYLNYGHVTRKIDVYAFGVVLFQVLCQKMPWDREGESYYRKEDEDLGQWARQNVDSEIQGEISDYCLNAFTGIIQKCLSLDPKKRPTMDEVALTLQDALEC